MNSSFLTLRHTLAKIFRSPNDLERLGTDGCLDMTLVDLKGSPLDSWTAVLEAARKQRKLANLFKRIAAECEDNATLLNLLNKVEQDQLATNEPFVCSVDLSAIQIDESDERDLADVFAFTMHRLPKHLVEVALSPLPPKLDGGSHTAEAQRALDRYRMDCTQHEGALNRQRELRRSALDQKSRQIYTLQALSAPKLNEPSNPYEPVYPTVNRNWNGELNPYDIERVNVYHRDLEEYQRRKNKYESNLLEANAAYQRDMAAYKSMKATLPTLQIELKELEFAFQRATSDITAFKLEQVQQKAALEDRIRAARDLDLIEHIGRLLNEVASLLSKPVNSGFEMFAKFLLAAAVNAKCLQIQIPAIAALVNAFLTMRSSIEQQLEGRSDEIGRPWVAAIGVTRRAISKNESLLSDIRVILESFAAEELDDKLNELNRLQSLSFPSIPEYEGLVSPADLDRMSQLVTQRNQALHSALKQIEWELSEGGRADEERISATVASAEAVHAAMLKNAVYSISIPQGIESILALAVNGASVIGAGTNGICDAFRIELERRSESGADALMGQACPRYLLVEDAKELIGKHKTTACLQVRESLAKKFESGKALTQSFELAVVAIREIPEHERDSFLQRYRTLWIATLVPFRNIKATNTLAASVHRLKDALGSAVPAYMELSERGQGFIWRAFIALMCISPVWGLLIWVAVVLRPPNDGDDFLTLLILAFFVAAGTHFWCTCRIAISLYYWRSFARRRLSSAA